MLSLEAPGSPDVSWNPHNPRCMWQHFYFTHEEIEANRACVTHVRSYNWHVTDVC